MPCALCPDSALIKLRSAFRQPASSRAVDPVGRVMMSQSSGFYSIQRFANGRQSVHSSRMLTLISQCRSRDTFAIRSGVPGLELLDIYRAHDSPTDRLHDQSSCFDRLSMRTKLSWHLPNKEPHPELVEG